MLPKKIYFLNKIYIPFLSIRSKLKPKKKEL